MDGIVTGIHTIEEMENYQQRQWNYYLVTQNCKVQKKKVTIHLIISLQTILSRSHNKI